MTALEQLGVLVATGIRGRLSPDLRLALRLHVVDAIGAWIATAATAEARALAAFRAEIGRSAAGGAGADSSLAVMINCALTRLSEIDDIHLASMTTPGAIVIPAALSIAAGLPHATADTLGEAILVGYEAMIRLGAAMNGPAILARGIWPTYLAAPLGVAAVAARLMDLDERQAALALALALTLAPSGVGRDNASTTSRWLAAGASARNGLLAALAARAGFTADTAMLDGKFFAGVYDITPDVAALTADLGESFKLCEVSFKPWCAARQTMAATQALKEIVEGGVAVAGIGEIDVWIPLPFQKMIDHGVAAGDRVSRLTSVQYQMAVAALAPEAAFDVGQSGELSPAVRDLMDKIKVHADDGLMQDFPHVWPARVSVRSGTTRSERLVTHVPGDPGRPFDEDRIGEKFHRFVARAIGEESANDVIGDCRAVLDGRRAPAQLLTRIDQARARAAEQ